MKAFLLHLENFEQSKQLKQNKKAGFYSIKDTNVNINHDPQIKLLKTFMKSYTHHRSLDS